MVYSMIHGLRIKDGKATYVSRYVRTSRLKQEETFGGAKFMKVTSKQWEPRPYTSILTKYPILSPHLFLNGSFLVNIL